MNVNDTLLAVAGVLGGVGGEAVLVNKTVTANGTYLPSADSADGYKKVVVNVPASTLTTKTITANGTYAASADNADGYSSVTVNVPQGLQQFTYTLVNDYTGGVTALSFFNELRAAAGTQEVFGYQNNIDPTDTTYDRLLYLASAVNNVQQWYGYKPNSTTTSMGQGSNTFHFALGASFTLYKGWTTP